MIDLIGGRATGRARVPLAAFFALSVALILADEGALLVYCHVDSPGGQGESKRVSVREP